MKRWPVLGVLATLLIVGCDEPSYGGITIVQTAGEFGAEVGADGLLMTHGHVMVFEAHLQSTNSEAYDALSNVHLDVGDGSIAMIHPTVYNFGWAIAAARPGRTEMEVVIDGVVEDTVPVTIVEAR